MVLARNVPYVRDTYYIRMLLYKGGRVRPFRGCNSSTSRIRRFLTDVFVDTANNFLYHQNHEQSEITFEVTLQV